MLKKLKLKFLLLSSATLLIFILITISTINLLTYNNIIRESDKVIEVISFSKDFSHMPNNKPNDNLNDDKFNPDKMNGNPLDENSFFIIVLDINNNIINIDTSRDSSITNDNVTNYKDLAFSKEKDRGFINNYRFIIFNNNNVKKLIFLDCDKKLNLFFDFLLISCTIALSIFIITVFVFYLLSERIIRPFAINYEKQKRFITDASHEIKTPLTIISTNIDILEMEYGSNECTADIHYQISNLKDLTNKLVFLSKSEENHESLNMIEMPISDITLEVVSSFKNYISSENKKLIINIQPLLTLKCNDNSIRQLISVLLDNAVKYSPNNSEIIFDCYKQNHNIVISVANESLHKISEDKVKNLFDRFYRPDSSRNSNTGGHGIGLSIAKAITTAHNGKININIKNDNIFNIIVQLPL